MEFFRQEQDYPQGGWRMKVFCCSQFNGELDLLEIKMETLNPIVDYFVLSESSKTHSGLDKPFYFEENKNRFKRFDHKIIYQKVLDTPQTYQDLLDLKPRDKFHAKVIQNVKDATWLNRDLDIAFIRDDYEKESVLTAISPVANDDDIVIVGDLDEIPRPSTLERVIENFDKDEVYLLQNDMFYMFLNLQKINESWFGSNVLSFHRLLENPIGKLRQYKEGNRIDNGGWHFTYMGGVESIIKKLESYSHQEFNNDNMKNRVQYIVDNCIKLSVDALGRPSQLVVRDIEDGTFPKYLVDNQDKFAEHIMKL